MMNRKSDCRKNWASESRRLIMSASGVLATLRGSTYRSVRLAASLAAALLDGLSEQPVNASVTIRVPRFCHAQGVCQGPTSCCGARPSPVLASSSRGLEQKRDLDGFEWELNSATFCAGEHAGR